MYVTPAQLDELRAILLIGIGFAPLLLIHLNLPEYQIKPKAVERPCPIGKVPPSECPHCRDHDAP